MLYNSSAVKSATSAAAQLSLEALELAVIGGSNDHTLAFLLCTRADLTYVR